MKYSTWQGNGYFGRWEEDEYGLPSYIYESPKDALKYSPQTTEKSIVHSHWHQIGNERITATFHESGFLQLYNSDRGLCCITPYQPSLSLYGAGIGVLKFKDGRYVLLKREFLDEDEIKEIRFGCGWGKFSFLVNSVKVEIIHWAPYGNLPIIITDVSINDKSNLLDNFFLLFSVGCWFVNFEPIYTGRRREHFGSSLVGNALSFVSKYVFYPMQLNTNTRRSRFATSFNYIARKRSNIVTILPEYHRLTKFDREEPVDYQTNPLPFFIEGENIDIDVFDARDVFKKNGFIYNIEFRDNLSFKNKVFSHPCVAVCRVRNKNGKFRIIWGVGEKKFISDYIKEGKARNIKSDILKRKKSSCIFQLKDVPWVKREWLWHSDYLQSSAMYDNYFQSYNVRQGSAYYYLHGIDGAVRDFAFFAIPLCYLNQKLAKEILKTILKITYPNGYIPYCIYGYGKTSSAVIHNLPSDLPIAFLWALTEYIFATRDFSFLDEIYPFYPLKNRKCRSVSEQILITCNYIMNILGVGQHGLIRVGTGDWNDPLQLDVKCRKIFFSKGESVYNTAFALYVLPRVVALLNRIDRDKSSKLQEFIEKLRKALNKQWNGKWLLRGWDGRGNPLGKNNFYLEHHTWALIGNFISDDKKKKIVNYINYYLDKPSKIGATIVHPPKKVKFNIIPKGHDTNGGIWPAMNMLLTWGYSRINSNLAKESLLKNTLCAHSEVYPHIWYGIWSGPDSYNSHYAKNPGETYCHFTPMTDFPVMNANIHSAPITSAIKICGIEPTLDGFYISPCLPDNSFSIETPLISIIRNNTSLSINYKPALCKEEKVKFVAEDNICKSISLMVKCNGEKIIFERKNNKTICVDILVGKEINLVLIK